MHQFICGIRREGGSAETSAAMPHGGSTVSGFGEDTSGCSFEEYTNVKDVLYDSTAVARKDRHRTVFGDRTTDQSHAPHDGGRR